MKNVILGLVKREFAKAASDVLIDIIQHLSGLLKGRNDNTMDKDADVIGELAERNRSSKK